MNLEQFAYRLHNAYWDSVNNNLKVGARKEATVRYSTLCEAAFALGLAPSPYAVDQTVRAAVESMGSRPAWRPVQNDAREAYDEGVVHEIVRELNNN